MAEVTGSLLLASNNFYREFSDDPVVTAAAAALPQMQGNGWTRDLCEAMSLGTCEALKLRAKMGTSADRYCASSYKNRSIQAHHPRMELALSRCGKHALETFPYTKYGTVQATVEVVTADAVTDEKKGSYYPATLTLEQSDMLVDGKRVHLSPGMNVTAEIKTGRRRVIEFLLSPVQRAGMESLRER